MKSNKQLEQDFKAWLSWNCSTLFLIKPVTGYGMDQLVQFGLIDSFLKDEGKDYEEDMLYILFKPKSINDLEIFIRLQEVENLHFVEDYDYDCGYVVVVYNIPTIYRADFELFKKGQYSKLSPHFKHTHQYKVIIAGKEQPSFQYMVFYKDKKLKASVEEYFEMKLSDDDELWGIPSTERETLIIQNIYNGEEKRITDSPTETGGAAITKKFHSFGRYHG